MIVDFVEKEPYSLAEVERLEIIMQRMTDEEKLLVMLAGYRKMPPVLRRGMRKIFAEYSGLLEGELPALRRHLL
ncbi:MAG: hypothetical protein KBS74_01270 [Clostridiales bacterium]|nr:hypothetical protein [Candidatus Cacconaster stercorequi]